MPDSRILLQMHEIAHILGLGHVRDRTQAMHPRAGFVRDFGAGDLAGLHYATHGICTEPVRSPRR